MAHYASENIELPDGEILPEPIASSSVLIVMRDSVSAKLVTWIEVQGPVFLSKKFFSS